MTDITKVPLHELLWKLMYSLEGHKAIEDARDEITRRFARRLERAETAQRRGDTYRRRALALRDQASGIRYEKRMVMEAMDTNYRLVCAEVKQATADNTELRAALSRATELIKEFEADRVRMNEVSATAERERDELRLELLPLRQQFDDWARQNREAYQRAESAERERDELRAALIASEKEARRKSGCPNWGQKEPGVYGPCYRDDCPYCKEFLNDDGGGE